MDQCHLLYRDTVPLSSSCPGPLNAPSYSGAPIFWDIKCFFGKLCASLAKVGQSVLYGKHYRNRDPPLRTPVFLERCYRRSSVGVTQRPGRHGCLLTRVDRSLYPGSAFPFQLALGTPHKAQTSPPSVLAVWSCYALFLPSACGLCPVSCLDVFHSWPASVTQFTNDTLCFPTHCHGLFCPKLSGWIPDSCLPLPASPLDKASLTSFQITISPFCCGSWPWPVLQEWGPTELKLHPEMPFSHSGGGVREAVWGGYYSKAGGQVS